MQDKMNVVQRSDVQVQKMPVLERTHNARHS